MKTLSALGLIGLTGLILLGSGCNPAESAKDKLKQEAADLAIETALEKTTGGQVDIDSADNQIAFKDNKTGDSVVYGENISIPADFPKDIPVYPGARAMSASTSSEGSTLTLVANAEVSKVMAWYADQFKDWQEDSSMTAGPTEIRQYSKDKITIALSISAQDKESYITIVRSVKD